MRYIERDASFFVSMLQQQIPTILAYSSATVAVQTAGVKCVIIARDRLTLDTVSLVPFINGLLPVPSPVSLNLTIVHVRYDAPPTTHLPLSRTFLLSHTIPTPGDTSRVLVVNVCLLLRQTFFLLR
jgi:hypothetical protein